MNLKNPLTLSLSALLIGTACAGESDEAKEVMIMEPRTICDVYEDVFDIFDIYESDTGFLRSFAFTGRYQGHWFHNTQDAGAFARNIGDDNDTDWFNRRFRFGFKAEFLDRFSLAAEFDLDRTFDDGEPSRLAGGANGPARGEVGFFQTLEMIELQWDINDRLAFVIGKLDPNTTLEDSISSKRLYTIERSSASDMLNHAKTAGAKIEIADVMGNDFVFGVYNSGTEDDHLTGSPRTLDAQLTDLPQTNGDWGFQAKINRDLWTAASGP